MRVLGIMSGTSVDGVDVALAEFCQQDGDLQMDLLGHREFGWDDELRQELLSVLPPAVSDVAAWCRLETRTGQAFGRSAVRAIEQLGRADLVCCHGQTLYHWVDDTGHTHGSLQIGNPAFIHAACGLPVICDLRSADIAAGGQGAPLASTLDHLWLADEPTAALNLGGIANVTIVGAGTVVCGDTGPADCLLDATAQRLAGKTCDTDGKLALTGTIDRQALSTLLADPYYARPLPKSTGREYYTSDYVENALAGLALSLTDLMATLTELTACTVADVINCRPVRRVVASGGGVRNPALMARLRARCKVPVITSDELGMPSKAKEAYLFALLGYLTATGQPGTVTAGPSSTSATGAVTPVVLGSCTPPTRFDSPAGHVTRLTIQNSSSPEGILA